MDPTTRFPHKQPESKIIASYQIPATLEAVSDLCASLAEQTQIKFGVSTGAEIDLGIVEAMSNIVRHGYKRDAPGNIEFECRESNQGWTFIVRDHGIPIPREKLENRKDVVIEFDPDDLHNLPEGGMGIGLIFTIFDSVQYQSDATNTLTLFKNFDAFSE